MARRRMIDPSFWDDEDLGQECDAVRILFVACISNADDYGKLSGSAAYLKKIAFGFTDKTIEQVEEMLGRMHDRIKGFHRYFIESRPYIALLHWHKYQRVDKPYPSTIPDPPDAAFDPPARLPEQPAAPHSRNHSKNDSKNGSKNDSENHSLLSNEVSKEEKEGKKEASNIGASPEPAVENDSDDAAACRLSLCKLFNTLNCRVPSTADRTLNAELANRADWSEHVALAALELCHRQAAERDPKFQAKSLGYYKDAIVAALESGAMPGQSRKGGNRGINRGRTDANHAMGFGL